MTKAISQADLTHRKLLLLADKFESNESIPARLAAASTIVQLLRQLLTHDGAQPARSKAGQQEHEQETPADEPGAVKTSITG